MKKSQLKQIIKECIQELQSRPPVNLDPKKVADIEVDNDGEIAYITTAWYPIVDNPQQRPEDWRELTEDELDWLNDQPEFQAKAEAEILDRDVGRAEDWADRDR
jgi:hypothetical protein